MGPIECRRSVTVLLLAGFALVGRVLAVDDPPAPGKDKAAEIIAGLSYGPSRFDTWIERCQLRALQEDNRTLDPDFLGAFDIRGDKATRVAQALEAFLKDAQALGDEMMFRGDPAAVSIPGEANKDSLAYVEVPARKGPQLLLIRKHAADLAPVVGDPATALALVRLVSRDHNAHGELAIAHPIVRRAGENGEPVYIVRRILLTFASRSPIGEGGAVASAASLAGLPEPYRLFVQPDTARATATGGPVSESLESLSHPSLDDLGAEHPDADRQQPRLGPLLTGHPNLAAVIMEHTDLVNFTGRTELLTLLHLGVLEGSMRELGEVVDQAVVGLSKRLEEKNKGAKLVVNGPATEIEGLTAEEHRQAVEALERKVAEQFADFPSKLVRAVGDAFAHTTRDYLKDWTIEVTEDPNAQIRFIGGPSTRTKAVAIDPDGVETTTSLPPYPLHFLYREKTAWNQ